MTEAVKPLTEPVPSAPKGIEIATKPPTRQMTPLEDLRVYKEREKLIKAIKDAPTVLLIAGTGTGKTRAGTQIALEALGPNGKMAVTENLRKATEESPETIVADRKKQFPDEKVGDVIGFQNKYHREVTKNTRMLFCPIQTLLNQAKNSPDGLLMEYDCVFVDEVHKESKSNEILLATLRDIQKKRASTGKPLKIILTSATMDADKLGGYFKGAVKVEVPGVTFDIDMTFHDKDVPIAELPQAAAEKIKWAIDKGDKGNALIFLSGIHQIDAAQKALTEMNLGDDVIVRPYIGSMSKAEHEEISTLIKTSGKRLIFLATNAAQESLTWPIKIVVDTCTQKQLKLDPLTGRSYLEEEKAPLDHLMQRKGRVGRNDPKGGELDKYYPLTTRSDWEGRQPHEKAEITRTDLTNEVLTLLANGYDPHPSSKAKNRFEYLNPPDQGHLDMAFKRLAKLGAVDKAGNLTEKGRFMASLQLDMNNASLVADGIKYGVTDDAVALAAMLEEYPNAFENANPLLEKLRGSAKSDLIPLINVFNNYKNKSEVDQRQFAINLGLHPEMMQDAFDLYFMTLKEASKQPHPFIIKMEKVVGAGLDLAIHDSFADAEITGSSKKGLMVEGIGGTAPIRMGKRSVLKEERTLPYFISTNIRTIMENGEPKKIAELNHAMSEEAQNYLNPKEQIQEDRSKKIEDRIDEAKNEEQKTEEKPIEEEKKPEEPPKPPAKPLPFYKRWWNSFKSWFSGWFK